MKFKCLLVIGSMALLLLSTDSVADRPLLAQAVRVSEDYAFSGGGGLIYNELGQIETEEECQ